MTPSLDPLVERLRQRLLDRSTEGIAKYGVTLERTDLSLVDWLRHLQEELLDGALYAERAIQDADKGLCRMEYDGLSVSWDRLPRPEHETVAALIAWRKRNDDAP